MTAKFDVLRTDYHALQTDSAQRRASLEAAVENARDRLRTYEQVSCICLLSLMLTENILFLITFTLNILSERNGISIILVSFLKTSAPLSAQLEFELDATIVQGAHSSSSSESAPLHGIPSSHSSPSSSTNRHADLISTLAGSLPTAGARRVQQSISLAQRLLQKHRECEVWRNKCTCSPI